MSPSGRYVNRQVCIVTRSAPAPLADLVKANLSCPVVHAYTQGCHTSRKFRTADVFNNNYYYHYFIQVTMTNNVSILKAKIVNEM